MTQKTRRSFGQIEKMSSGKFRARYVGPDGHLHKAPTTFFDKADAIAWLRAEQKLLEFDQWRPPAQRHITREIKAMTVGEWMSTWLDLIEPVRKPSTMQNYRRQIDARILNVTGDAAHLKDIPITQLTRRDVAYWWDAISATYGVQVYNQLAYKRLHTAFEAAIDREYLTENPIKLKASHAVPAPTRKELPEEATMTAIINELPERYQLIGILTFFHGLRIGEALALRRKDIIDTGHTIHIWIRGTAYRKIGQGMIRLDTPKTDAGHRKVPIFPHFHHQLRDHLTRFTPPHDDATVFLTARGKTIMDTTYRTGLTTAKNRAGITDRLSPHYGRVWLITALAEAGMTIPAIGDILGQTDLKTITETYMRTSAARRDESLERVDAVLSSAAGRASQSAGSDALKVVAGSGGVPDNVIDLRQRRRRLV